MHPSSEMSEKDHPICLPYLYVFCVSELWLLTALVKLLPLELRQTLPATRTGGAHPRSKGHSGLVFQSWGWPLTLGRSRVYERALFSLGPYPHCLSQIKHQVHWIDRSRSEKMHFNKTPLILGAASKEKAPKESHHHPPYSPRPATSPSSVLTYSGAVTHRLASQIIDCATTGGDLWGPAGRCKSRTQQPSPDLIKLATGSPAAARRWQCGSGGSGGGIMRDY